MPVVLTGPYSLANDVLNLARSIVNDAALALSGNLLSNSQPYTFELLNTAYRKLQRGLVNNNVETFIKDTQLLQVPVANPIDPATQIYISFIGTFDGTGMHPNPILPPDMIIPSRLWERQSATSQIYVQMFPVNDGLPSRPQTGWLREWDWINDKLYMCGATQVNDVRLRYTAFLPDLTDGNSEVLIIDAKDALAFYVAEAYAATRGSVLAPDLGAKGDYFMKQIANRTAKRLQRGNHRRVPYSARGSRRGWGSI